MRPATTLLQLAMAVSSVTPVVSAWPNWMPQRDSLIVRADDDSDSSSGTSTPTATDGDSSTPRPTGTTTKASGNTSSGNLNTATPTKTGTTSGDKSGGKKTTAAPTRTEFPADAPLGGASMIIPANTALGTALYRISDYVTFSWNYTSLLGTPTAIDVLASCSKAAATWTLTANMSFETSVNYVWDTTKEANDAAKPLLTEQYMLIIKDSDYAIGDTPDPGYLGANQALRFGLYAGKPYKNWTDWTCPGCHASAAVPAVDTQAVKFAVAMSAATVVCLTWLSTGLGLN